MLNDKLLRNDMKEKIRHIFYFFLLIFNYSALNAQNQPLIDSLLIRLENSKPDSSKVNILNHLASQLNDINDQQLIYSQRALMLAEQLHDIKGQAVALKNMGCYYYVYLRNFDRAKKCFDSAVTIAKYSGNTYFWAKINLEIAKLIDYSTLGEAALTYLNNAFEGFKSLNRNSDNVETLKELALLHGNMRQKDEAFAYLEKYKSQIAQTNIENKDAEIYTLTARITGDYFNDTTSRTDFYKKAIDCYENQRSNSNLKTVQSKAYLYFHMANSYWNSKQWNKARNYSLKLLEITDEIDKTTPKDYSLNNLKWAAYTYIIRAFVNEQNNEKADKYIKRGLDYFSTKKDLFHKAKLLWSIESTYWRFAQYYLAFQYQQQELEAWENLGNKYWTCIALENNGMVYGRLGNYEKQVEIDQQLLQTSEIHKITLFTMYACKDLAKAYFMLNQLDSALFFAQKAVELNKECNNSFISMVNYFTLGSIYEKQSDYKAAIENFTMALEIKEKYSYPINTHDRVASESALAAVYLKLKDYNKALSFANKSIALALTENAKEILCNDYYTISQIYKQLGSSAKTIEYLEKHIDLQKELALEDAKRAIQRAEIENIKKQNEQEMKMLLQDKKLQETKLQQQKYISYSFIVGFILLLALAFVIFRSYREKKKDNILLAEQKHEILEKNEELNQLNEEISAHRDNLEMLNSELQQMNEEVTTQRDEIEAQRDILVKQKKNITDSIVYASRIQNALLPSTEALAEHLTEHFILFQPRDIVSGDFYWCRQIKNFLYIVVADCTGHGVPGAFMSMLGISLLNEIVSKRDLNPPNLILNELRKRIKNSLHQTGQRGENQDGMDISFCMLNLENNHLQFAGAYNPLYLVKSEELRVKNEEVNVSEELRVKSEESQINEETEQQLVKNSSLLTLSSSLTIIEADRMPIGVHPKDNQDFTNHKIQLQKGDSLYIFSDGYVSQFGGEKGEKLKSKRFQEALLKNQEKTMNEQKQILVETFQKWQANHWEQVDDVLVIGFKI